MIAHLIYLVILLLGSYQILYAREENYRDLIPATLQLLDIKDAEQPADQILPAAQRQIDQAKQKFQSISSLQDSTSSLREQHSFKDRWYIGGVFHTNRISPLQLTIAPAIGYQPRPFLLMGMSANIELTMGYMPKAHISYQWQPDYSLFTEVYKGGWFLHIEYVDRWKKINPSEILPNSRQWIAGIGKRYQWHRLKGHTMMVYNFQEAQVTAAVDVQVLKWHILVLYTPQADSMMQQRTWTLKCRIDLW